MGRTFLTAAMLVIAPLSGLGCTKHIPQAPKLTTTSPTASSADAGRETEPSAPFAGAWESCAGAESPEECSRYLLLQRGKNICGIWSYFATGDLYEGRVIAEAISALEARRTLICGRPGSETATECEAGWENVDRPLFFCDGKLSDLDPKNGSCFADFERSESSEAALSELADQSWIQACLSRKEQGEVK